mgnify:CR=1 FL=1
MSNQTQTCWTCADKIATHKEFRDALGENEFTCDDCHREEYPEQYETNPVTITIKVKKIQKRLPQMEFDDRGRTCWQCKDCDAWNDWGVACSRGCSSSFWKLKKTKVKKAKPVPDLPAVSDSFKDYKIHMTDPQGISEWRCSGCDDPDCNSIKKPFNQESMDNLLYPDQLDWSFNKPREGGYQTIYIFQKD